MKINSGWKSDIGSGVMTVTISKETAHVWCLFVCFMWVMLMLHLSLWARASKTSHALFAPGQMFLSGIFFSYSVLLTMTRFKMILNDIIMTPHFLYTVSNAKSK